MNGFTCEQRATPDSLRAEWDCEHGDQTPGGLFVAGRNEYGEAIVVAAGPNGVFVDVFRVSHQDEEVDRYAVVIDGKLYTTDLRAPKRHRELVGDYMGEVADAAVAFATKDGIFPA